VSAALEAARASGLVRAGEPLLVMLSGGADSVCLLDVALRLGAEVSALHVNYRLRDDADEDEQHCRALCGRLGVELFVERVRLEEEGNLHALARDERYRQAELHAAGDYAAAHTASDQAETVLYRLAVSPGRRALLGMAPRRGRLVRPLLAVTRADTEAHCRERGLDWRDDASNRDPRFARARVRHGLLAELREVAPQAERTIAETAAQLRDESEVLDRAVGEALVALGGGPAVEAVALVALGPALARLVLRRLAEREAGSPRALSRKEADAVLSLAGASLVGRGNGDATLRGPGAGSRSLDLGGGLRAVAEYGTVRFKAGEDAPSPEPATLPIPGMARFGEWTIEARVGGGGEVELSATALGASATVRGWRDGDRMRPLGLGGSKSLQDLFTDRKVPRALRRALPVLEADGVIAWVAGVAVDERFAAAPGSGRVIGLTARRPGAA
jgi:tRNA(Ile)-lysidine synthase